MIVIPKSFQLSGRTWRVELHKLILDDAELCGDCCGTECIIRLKSDLSPEAMQHTFYHELCHAMCYTLGWRALNKDEERIDALGNVLFQYLKTKKGQPTTPL